MSLRLGTNSALLRRYTLPVALAAAIAGGGASAASASTNMLSMFQDNDQVAANPEGTLATLRLLGVDQLRLSFSWQSVAPSPGSHRRPRFNAADPAAYPARNWQIYDTIIETAARDGLSVNLDLTGGAPLWATGPHPPRMRGKVFHQWEPSARQYGLFVQAVGTRYSGSYTPPGASSPLPRVSFWSVWNEPDYGPSLAPQGLYPNHLTIEHSPAMYRGLVDAAWSALHRTGHGGDTFLFGEVAPRGESTWGIFSGMRPLPFLRAMYCVDSRYRPLRGKAAALRDCPTSAAGSRRFRSEHPALFAASAFADHAYMRWYRPNHEQNPDPVNHLNTSQYSSLGVLGNLTRALDRLNGVYGSHTRFPIYDTEFGYITSPPQRRNKYPWVSPTTAAYYLNWAEYIHWRNPRLLSYHQYLLRDALPATKQGDFGGFASGLITFGGQPKPTYDAYRLPLYLPHTAGRRGGSLEVWGCARPAHYASLDSGAAQSVQIQFAPSGTGAFNTVATVPITNPHGYFDTRVAFPSSGTVILAYTYPSGEVIHSRRVQIRLR